MAELDARRIEVLANAARLIQRQIRTHLTRKEFIILRKATIQMQKHWRGLLFSTVSITSFCSENQVYRNKYILSTARSARKLYQHMRREDASIRVQKYARAHAARKSYTTSRASAVVIQTGLRAMAARNEYRHRRRTRASIIIQVTVISGPTVKYRTK